MNKKILMLLVILGSVWLLLTLTGCTAINESKGVTEDRLEIIDVINMGGRTYIQILYDKETKVQYMFYMGQQTGAWVTLLVDAEGKPLLYEGGE